jgi:hypothetical protein
MYARVARFEGGDTSTLDEDIADMKRQMDAFRSGDVPADARSPEQIRTLLDTVTRWVELVDRTSGASVAIAFSKTEEDVRRADAALNAMSPVDDAVKRTSADIYEVVLDESFG